MILLKEKISNHKTFPEVERTLALHGFYPNGTANEIEFFYTIEHHKNGENVSHLFTQKVPRWVISNEYLVLQRDEKLLPIPSPDWTDNQPENEKYLTAPAFDYFVKMVFENDVNLKSVLRKYIQLDDQKGAFD